MTTLNKHQTLANVLVERQILTQSQLEQAQQHQQQHSVNLDEAIIALSMLSADDLATICGDVFQVRALKLEDVEIDRDAVRHVPAAVARRHYVIPVRRSGNTLAVAMVDPLDVVAMEALKQVTDFDIIPFVARYDAIEHALFVHYGDATPAEDDDAPRAGAAPLMRPRAVLDEDRATHVGKSIQLNRHHTFESFVADPANEFPLNVAAAIADQKGEDSHNPFHAWGPPGSGKSHLMHAMANYVTAHTPLKRYVLTTGQRFCDDLFQSIRDRKINFFRYLYRELDLLLIDDAEVLMWRDWAQRELVETFRHLRSKGRHLAIFATRNLSAESRIIPELRAELATGVIAGFGRYSQHGKTEIAQRCAGNVRLPADILTRLIQASGDNLYDLIELFQHVTVATVAGEGEVTADLAEDLIRLHGAAASDGVTTRPKNAAGTPASLSTRNL